MSYRIAGATIKNEYLALGTIFGTVGIAMAKMGGSKDDKSSTPLPIEKESITATSKGEEDFIRQFVSEAEGEKKH